MKVGSRIKKIFLLCVHDSLFFRLSGYWSWVTPLSPCLDLGTVTALLPNLLFPSSSKHLCLPLDQGYLDTLAKQKAVFPSEEKNHSTQLRAFSHHSDPPTKGLPLDGVPSKWGSWRIQLPYGTEGSGPSTISIFRKTLDRHTGPLKMNDPIIPLHLFRWPLQCLLTTKSPAYRKCNLSSMTLKILSLCLSTHCSV